MREKENTEGNREYIESKIWTKNQGNVNPRSIQVGIKERCLSQGRESFKIQQWSLSCQDSWLQTREMNMS